MNKFEIRTEQKKKSILQSALNNFKAKGYTNVSIKEIAADAKVSQVSIYNYFGNKENLVAECVEIIMQEIYCKAETLLSSDMPFADKLDKAFDLCDTDISHLIQQMFSDVALGDSTLSELLLENINIDKEKIYAKFIEAGKQTGDIPGHISTNSILLFMNAINIAGAKIKPNDMEKNQATEIKELFLYGLLRE